MNITFKELRSIKHSLPTGSVSRIAKQLDVTEQTIRNFFGAQKYESGEIGAWNLQSGPEGGIMNIRDTRILDAANAIISEMSGQQRRATSS